MILDAQGGAQGSASAIGSNLEPSLAVKAEGRKELTVKKTQDSGVSQGKKSDWHSL